MNFAVCVDASYAYSSFSTVGSSVSKSAMWKSTAFWFSRVIPESVISAPSSGFIISPEAVISSGLMIVAPLPMSSFIFESVFSSVISSALTSAPSSSPTAVAVIPATSFSVSSSVSFFSSVSADAFVSVVFSSSVSVSSSVSDFSASLPSVSSSVCFSDSAEGLSVSFISSFASSFWLFIEER